MNRLQIERYFKELSEEYDKPCKVILSGAAAGALYGNVRPTSDVDFELKTEDWEGFETAAKSVGKLMAIDAQYSEDIDKWSMITYLDYKNHTYLYKKFGNLEVHLMEPAYWAIGKLTRFLDSDIQDLIKVFKDASVSWKAVADVAGRALKASPKSTSCSLFKKQTEHFLTAFGKKIWGADYDSQKALEAFHQSCM
ncbi:MAG: hypothetical protein KC649_07330 [Candidatus Omnitrophica bacterium]|nr:hypothetical protein [Candidatus Omnitrophota bacterium]